jgi:hypothetical protein
MKLNLGRMDLFAVALLVASLAFISWQVNQTARAVSAVSTWAHAPAQSLLLNPSLSSHLQPIPYCEAPSAQAQSGAHGNNNDGDDDDDGGPYQDEPDDPAQDVFPT